MIIAGIDIGIKGAMAIGKGEKSSFEIEKIHLLPIIRITSTRRDYIPAELFKLISKEINLAIVESPLLLPYQAIQTCGSLYKGLGYVEMALIAKNISYRIIRPSTWKRELLKDIPGDNLKVKSIIACKRLFPNVNLRRTEKSTKNDDNIAEAILLAYYGWSQWRKE